MSLSIKQTLSVLSSQSRYQQLYITKYIQHEKNSMNVLTNKREAFSVGALIARMRNFLERREIPLILVITFGLCIKKSNRNPF